MPEPIVTREDQERFIKVTERVTEQDLVDALEKISQAFTEYLLQDCTLVYGRFEPKTAAEQKAFARLNLAIAHGTRLAAAWE
ncbi:MAG: hypothetical protein ACRCV9_03565 [Burkholderiaceae bacterium]